MSHSRYVLETSRWEEIDFPEPYEKTGYASHVEASRLGTLVISHLRMGSQEKIIESMDRLHDILEMNEEEGRDYRVLLCNIIMNQMKSMQAWHAGDQEEALLFAAKAAELEGTRPVPNGPNIILKPAHEFYGELLLEYGMYSEAVRQFGIGLSRIPNKSLTLLNMARAHAALGEIMEAGFYYSQLMENWKEADKAIDGYQEAVDFLKENPLKQSIVFSDKVSNEDLRNFISYQLTNCYREAF